MMSQFTRRPMGWAPRCVAMTLLLAGAVHCRAQQATAAGSGTGMAVFRVEAEGFEAAEADIRALLNSVGRELWRHFPGHRLEPMVVMRGRQGPITLFKRNGKGEIVVRLDTEKTFWAQYSYQFAHEFCHVLCGYREVDRGNKWFEETLCETASLYTLRAMARAWRKDPPYAHWSDYRDSLRDYADDVIRGRDRVHELYAKGLAGFYAAHRGVLEKDPTARELNGAMSIVLLHLFEEKPERWESIRWLNTIPARSGDAFGVYLQNWHNAAPTKHRAFIRQLGELYGVAVKPE